VTRYTLDQLRQRYVIEGKPLEANLEEILRADTRAGARAILASIEKRRFENRSEGQRLRKMLRFETLLWDEGQDFVAGVDEAGMSPLAGPVSAAAVILKPGTRINGIDDSKKLDANSREALSEEIKEKAASWSVAFVEVEEIDTINIYWAGILAMRRAVEGLGVIPQHLLIDAKRLKEIAIPQQAIIKGDAKSASIAAASILAKVSRDALMRTLDTRHPGYGFADHKGYPVRAHYTALAQLGACPAHRRSFGPVREVLGLPPLPPWPLHERAGATSGPVALDPAAACMETPVVHPFCFSCALLPSELLERSSKRSAPLARSCPILLSFFASSLAVASRKPSAACFPAFDDFRSSSICGSFLINSPGILPSLSTQLHPTNFPIRSLGHCS